MAVVLQKWSNEDVAWNDCCILLRVVISTQPSSCDKTYKDKGNKDYDDQTNSSKYSSLT